MTSPVAAIIRRVDAHEQRTYTRAQAIDRLSRWIDLLAKASISVGGIVVDMPWYPYAGIVLTTGLPLWQVHFLLSRFADDMSPVNYTVRCTSEGARLAYRRVRADRVHIPTRAPLMRDFASFDCRTYPSPKD